MCTYFVACVVLKSTNKAMYISILRSFVVIIFAEPMGSCELLKILFSVASKALNPYQWSKPAESGQNNPIPERNQIS